MPSTVSVTISNMPPGAVSWVRTSSTVVMETDVTCSAVPVLQPRASSTWSMHRVSAAMSSGSIAGNMAIRNWFRPSLR